MYAIIATGGKQYKVEEGDVIKVEKLGLEAGSEVTFDQVLLVGDKDVKVGTPTVDGASVKAALRESQPVVCTVRYPDGAAVEQH